MSMTLYDLFKELEKSERVLYRRLLDAGVLGPQSIQYGTVVTKDEHTAIHQAINNTASCLEAIRHLCRAE